MPRTAGRGRLLSAAVALVLLGTLLAAAYDRAREPDRAALAAGTQCADVMLVMVPGNGEGASTTPVGIGRTMGRFASTYTREAARSGRTVQTRVAPYRTRSLGWLRPVNPAAPASRSIGPTRVRNWGVGVNGIRDWVVNLLAARAGSCPAQGFVLGGYGQGAAVVHRVLRRLGTNAVSRRVIGAVMVSDPDRNRYTRALRWGRPAAPGSAQGIFRATGVFANGDVPYGGSYVRAISVCRDNDVACDFGRQRASTALTIAATYYRYNADQLDRSAVDLAHRTRAIPDPRPADSVVTTTVGTAVRHKLVADVLPTYASSLRWAAVGLPAGMSLSRSGVFSGTPRAAGTWTIRYTVRNIAHPAYSRPIPGTVVLRAASASASPSPSPSPTPTTSPPPAQTAAATSAGGDTSCTVRSDRSLWCWGDNYEGQVGVNSRDNKTTPQRVGSGLSWLSVNTGGTHSCAISTARALYCWGRNDYGQVGDGTRSRRLTPVRVGTRSYLSVATNTHHTCAVATDRSLWCWGNNDNGQLGLGDRTTRLVPTRVTAWTGWVSVSTGAWHTCGHRTDNSLVCWGANMFGQLGLGDTTTRLTPARVRGPGEGFGYRTVSAGDTHSCAVTTTGRVRCWGANTSGQVGDGTATLRALPVDVADGTSYLDVDAGLLTSCGVTTARQVRCWGAGWTGLMGAGAVNESSRPVPVSTSQTFQGVEVGWGHSCAVATTGATWCWGLSSAGQIGKGNHVTVRTPVQVTS